MKTVPLYLSDSYMKEMDAVVLEVIPEGQNRWRIILDKTVFYPMGGGQPTDQGTLTGDGWTGKVYQVLTRDGEIVHFAESESPPSVGSSLHGVIDWIRRYKHMRLHSAGHVVDFAMYLLGYSPKTLHPLKGDHGKKPYIMYSGVVDTDITRELSDKSNELVGNTLDLVTEFVPLADLEKDAIYLQPGLPADKPLRKLTLAGVGSVADGGTQVKNTGEVGNITIGSITTIDGNTTVSYTLE